MTNVTGDAADLDDYIRGVIAQSASLLAVVTDVTKESWWVPFEIGIAYDQSCWLATFVQEQRYGVQLPSFLGKHPRLRNHDPDLHDWCQTIGQHKERILLTERALASESASMDRPDRGTYLREMRTMTARYR